MKPEHDSESSLPAYLILTRPGTLIAFAVGGVLFVTCLIMLPATDAASERGRIKWVGLLSVALGWAAGHVSDLVMKRGWWSTGARAARAESVAWMGDTGARRRRLIVILIALTILFVTVVAAFSLSQ